MSTAVSIEAFQDYAGMVGTELLIIDAGTTTRAFEAKSAPTPPTTGSPAAYKRHRRPYLIIDYT